MSLDDKDTKQIATLYSVLQSDSVKLIKPKSVTKKEVREWLKMMIAAKQPRLERKDGRKYHELKYYRMPKAFLPMESNFVNYNASTGVVNNTKNEIFATREDDPGAIICSYIWKHGRKTIDELIAEMNGYDKIFLTLLVTKLVEDGYLQEYKEKDRKKTLELVEESTEENDNSK